MQRLSQLLFALCLFTPWIVAQEPVRDQYVEARLVSLQSALVPGQSTTLALRLEHDEKWHTYWKSSTTGFATSLTWDLPEGFTVSDIAWPVPSRYTLADITDFIFEGVTYLPVTLQLPESLTPGETVTLRATAEWLMCEDICIPGSAELALTLPIVATAGEAQASAWHDDLQTTLQNLPPSPAELRDQGVALPDIQAYAHQEAIYLHLTTPIAHELYFFDAQAQVKAEPTQQIQTRDAGTLLRLPLSPYLDTMPDKLQGVLWSAEPWHDDLHGLQLELPVEPMPADLPSTAGAQTPLSGEPQRSLATVLGLAFLGGLILNLMPCVFPVLGIKIMGFVHQAGQDRAKVIAHGLVFALGVLISFWLLAGALLLLRSGGQELGWGFQLQEPGFVYFLMLLLFLFALNMSGLFEIGQSAVGVGSGLMHKQGLSGSFFSGVLATVVATPCAAPFLAPALGAALTLPPVSSLVVFTTIGLGLATPYLLLSMFPQLIRMLPRPGAWMETFKQAMSFLLYGTVGYLLWILAGQLDEARYGTFSLLMVFFSLVITALAAWILGRWGAFSRKTTVRRVATASSVILLLGSAIWAWPTVRDNPLTWQTWSPERVSELRAEGRIIYVDFTARWCATCQTNKAAVFGSAEVRNRFAELDIAPLKADWTNRDERITQALADFGRSAIPFNLIYLPNRSDPVILPEVLTPGIVLEALETGIRED